MEEGSIQRERVHVDVADAATCRWPRAHVVLRRNEGGNDTKNHIAYVLSGMRAFDPFAQHFTPSVIHVVRIHSLCMQLCASYTTNTGRQWHAREITTMWRQ